MTDQLPDNRLSSGRNAAGRFVRGASGNPGGRPRREREIKHILDVATASVLRAAVEHALRGDAATMRLVLDRGAPIAKTVPVQIEAMATIGTQDLLAAIFLIVNGLRFGGISVEHVNGMFRMLANNGLRDDPLASPRRPPDDPPTTA